MLSQLPAPTFFRIACGAFLGLLFFVGTDASAADEKPSVDLALKQSQIADRYRQLETMLLKMAEYDASSNPRRAALLRQALSQGKERQVHGRLNELVKLFQREQLQKAVDGQMGVSTELKSLLDLLQSENRPDRIKNEQARVRGYIKQLDRIIRQQKSVQGRTEGGADQDALSRDQLKIAQKAQELQDAIDEAEGLAPTEEPAEDIGDESEDSDAKEPSTEADNDDENASNGGDARKGKPDANEEESGATKGDDSPARNGNKDPEVNPEDAVKGKEEREKDLREGNAASGKDESGESKSGESKSGESKSGESKSGESKSGESKSGESKSGESQPEFPGRKRIAAAEDRMRQAQEQLDRAERDEAVEKQNEARRLLELAKAELEEILRQLREEEIERVLAMLEGRFRRMLDMELKIQDNTVRLNKTPAAKRTRQFSLKVGKLSLDQRKVILEVDKALALLREEGSSVAFPEAVDQMRFDMSSVAKRLSDERVGDLTQAIEDDIVAALEEMIAALQKAQREADERRQQPKKQKPGQQQNGDPAAQPLVNKIAELKMIRALQMRVNTRTQTYARMLTDFEDPVGQATDDDLSESIQQLSSRQQRIHKVTSDIILGKNK